METTTRPVCAHDWQPIAAWYARYRCTLCHAIGCKFGVVQAKYVTRSNEIQPYRCEVRRAGERCNAPAVSSSYGSRFRCAEHRHGAHAASARRQGAAVAKPAQAPTVAAGDEAAAATRIEEPTTESR